jgi:hypothetical protein
MHLDIIFISALKRKFVQTTLPAFFNHEQVLLQEVFVNPLVSHHQVCYIQVHKYFVTKVVIPKNMS